MSTPLVTGRTVTLSKVKLSLNEEDKMVATCVYPSGDRTHSDFVKGEAVTEMGRIQDVGFVYVPSW